jgi:hypothetical protein
MAKKDVYTPARCMASGILLGRMAAGLASFERNLENKKIWSPAYAVRAGAEAAYDAADQLEKLQTTVRPQLKSLLAKLEEYKNVETGFGFNKEKAAETLEAARSDLKSIAQVVVKTCGKRRPEEGEGQALLEMKRIKRATSPRAPKNIPMELPVLVEEKAEETSSALPLVMGVLAIIGATFLVA